MNGRQQCPACTRHFDAPGPCRNFDPETGGECGYLEPPRTSAPRPARTRPTSERPVAPREGYGLTGPAVDPRDHLAQARAELAAIRERKARRSAA